MFCYIPVCQDFPVMPIYPGLLNSCWMAHKTHSPPKSLSLSRTYYASVNCTFLTCAIAVHIPRGRHRGTRRRRIMFVLVPSQLYSLYSPLVLVWCVSSQATSRSSFVPKYELSTNICHFWEVRPFNIHVHSDAYWLVPAYNSTLKLSDRQQNTCTERTSNIIMFNWLFCVCVISRP